MTGNRLCHFRLVSSTPSAPFACVTSRDACAVGPPRGGWLCGRWMLFGRGGALAYESEAEGDGNDKNSEPLRADASEKRPLPLFDYSHEILSSCEGVEESRGASSG